MEVSFKRSDSDTTHALYVTVPDEHAAALGRDASDIARDAADTYAAHNNYSVAPVGEPDISPAPIPTGAEHFQFALTEVVPQSQPVSNVGVAPVSPAPAKPAE